MSGDTQRTRINVSDADQYAWLDAVREELGLTWRGLMLKAEHRLLASERAWTDPSVHSRGPQTDSTTDGGAQKQSEEN